MRVDDDDFENRSEYVGPTTIPRARVPKSLERESVKLDPKIDRRRARTVISHRALARVSRRYTWTAFVAGAVGALVASLVYLALNGGQPAANVSKKFEVSPTGVVPSVATRPVRHGVLAPPERIATNAPSSGTAQQTAAQQTAAQQTATPPARGSSPSAVAVPRAVSHPEPAVRPRPAPKADEPEPVESAASPEAAPGSTSRAWVKPPDRKPWVR